MKRYTLTLLAAVFLVQPILRAQLTPYFETTIWVEDAIGNRDSVIIGFDQRATYDIDSIFNESEVMEPFDSILDVRAGERDPDYQNKLLKRLFTYGFLPFQDTCRQTNIILIYIHAKYQPVKVSWDKNQFVRTRCVNNAALTNSDGDLLVYPFNWDSLPGVKYYCMAGNDHFEIDLSEQGVAANPHRTYIEKEVEGAGRKEIYGIRFTSDFDFGACAGIVSIQESVKGKETNPKVFPNPATTSLTIELHSPEEQAAELTIVNQLGQRVLQQHFPKGQQRVQLEVAQLPPGLYFLHLLQEGRTLAVEKVVVVR